METRWNPQTEDTILNYVISMRKSEDSYLFAIVVNESERHIGNIKIGPINKRYNHADISYFIGEKDCRGIGYAREAVELICDFGFKVLGLRRIQAGVIEGNEASMGVLKSSGFLLEGKSADKCIIDGKYVAQLIFGILNKEANK
jgi:RimJ/RimL family protein N-acetyltransferase